jgi:hypothetical protein
MNRPVLLISILLLPTLCLADGLTFNAKLHRHKSSENPVLVDKIGVLSFDDAGRRLTFKDDAHDKFEIPYDSVTEVVFDVTTHMRGGTASQVLMATGLPGTMAGKAIARAHVHNYFFYLEYRTGGHDEQILLEVPHDSSKKVIDKATSIFGSKVTLADYQEKGEQIDPAKLPDVKSKDLVKIDKHSHPLPEAKPDKALIIIVCPPLAARYAGHGNQFKLHANDHVIAVNKQGTYSFAYLDPGKYRLVSQSENAYGFEMDLEAGKSYYFLQNIFDGILKNETSLSRNSPELVMYLLNGSYHSEWKPK